MRPTRMLRIIAVVAVVLGGSRAFGQTPTATDVLPLPPKDVAASKEIVAAKTPALDALGKEDAESLAKVKDSLDVGSRMHLFPSGLGFISVGKATYTSFQNPDATRIAKRFAYQDAYVDAKRNLARMLKGAVIASDEDIRKLARTVTTGEATVANAFKSMGDSKSEILSASMRGFVVYEVEDDGKGQIRVSIVSTPRTRAVVNHVSEEALDAKSLSDGLLATMTEIRTGVVPPIGGKIITIRGTNDVALVGFGSCVVASPSEPALQAAVRDAATRTAELRARASLVSLLNGDEATWRVKADQLTEEHVKQFEDVAGGRQAVAESEKLKAGSPLRAQPGAKDGFGPSEQSIRLLERTQKYFLSDFKFTDEYKAALKGGLPPGVLPVSWVDSEKGTVYAAMVYSRRIAALAESANTQMETGRTQSTGEIPRLDPSKGFKPANADLLPKGEVGPGPTGKVSKDEDL